jgi:hypothetical protein
LRLLKLHDGSSARSLFAPLEQIGTKSQRRVFTASTMLDQSLSGLLLRECSQSHNRETWIFLALQCKFQSPRFPHVDDLSCHSDF